MSDAADETRDAAASGRVPESGRVLWLGGVALILVLAGASNLPLIFGQFHYHDEAKQHAVCEQIKQRLDSWHGLTSAKSLALLLATQPQPPLRFLMSMPGVLLFPDTEFGLRLAAILLSLCMTWQVVLLGRDLGGKTVAFASGLLVAVSAAYGWTSMAFGWSLIVVVLLMCIRRLRTLSLDLSQANERRAFRAINALLIVAFLVNTGCVLFFLATWLLYGWANRRRRWPLMKTTAPFAAFLVLYYGFFLGLVPWYAYHVAGAASPYQGQLEKNLGRSGVSGLNYASFLDNVRGLNGHYAPYAAWFFFALALYYLATRERRTLLWLAPFALAWSFYLVGNTQQYLILVSICILPFGVQFLRQRLKGKAFGVAIGTFAVLFGTWNAVMCVWPYSEAGYPEQAWRLGYAARTYQHNVVLPYDAITMDINRWVGPDEFYSTDVGAALTRPRYARLCAAAHQTERQFRSLWTQVPLAEDPVSHCYRPPADPRIRPRAIIARCRLCPDEVTKTITYTGSYIKFYVLADPKPQ